jgi:hypothetical protein
MKRTWTDQDKQLLKKKYPISTPKELAELFPDKTIRAINSKAKVMCLKKAKQRFRFTLEQIEEIKRDYPTTLCADLAERYGCSIHTIEHLAFRKRLKKDASFLKEHFRKKMADPNHPARKYWIKKGHISANKGKKQTEYMSTEAIERTKATRFKKGQLPPNTLYDHAIIERKDSKGNIYKWIRISQGIWIPYHRYLWEQKYGKIPEGCNIQFKDRNALNCTIENLYMISRANQLKEENSSYARYPEEIRKLIQLKGVLNRQINKIEKQNDSN